MALIGMESILLTHFLVMPNGLKSVPGNASKITSQIFRIFDRDGNDFLDFKEFLMAIDVANRTTGGFILKKITYVLHNIQDEEKLRWSFRLYDMDNNGVIDIEEMVVIIETLDSIEGVKPGDRNVEEKNKITKGVIRYDENGNPQTIASTKQRAEEIFRVRKITFTFCCKVKQNLYFFTKAKCWPDEMDIPQITPIPIMQHRIP